MSNTKLTSSTSKLPIDRERSQAPLRSLKRASGWLP